MFKFSTKREIRHFHVVLVQARQRNVQKSVMHVQSCCFGYLNQLLFLPFSLTAPSSFIKVARLGFLGSIPLQFECYYVCINKDIEKRLPQLYCIKMKHCYDSCFIDIGVALAT